MVDVKPTTPADQPKSEIPLHDQIGAQQVQW